MNKIYKIASKIVSISYGRGPASKLLEQEFALYESANLPPDIVIRINKEGDEDTILSRNPSIHVELKKGFQCHFGNSSVTWRKEEEVVQVDFSFDEYKASWVTKLRNIQYNHPFQDVGQVFHELVLIPTLFFFSNDITLIHGAAVETPKGDAILFTGTGGAGKTSLELELVLRKGHKFLSDDICIVDQSGNIWPNYAFPKIYGYNTIGDRGIKTKLLQGRGIFDRVQWFFKFRRSPNEVRRRVNPYVFYNGRVSSGSKLSKLFVLFRGQYDHFSIEPISPAQNVVAMNIEVMKSDYGVFFKHLYWHKFNSIGMGSETILDVNDVLDSWRRLQLEVFNDRPCYLVKIPMESTAAELSDWFSSVLR